MSRVFGVGTISVRFRRIALNGESRAINRSELLQGFLLGQIWQGPHSLGSGVKVGTGGSFLLEHPGKKTTDVKTIATVHKIIFIESPILLEDKGGGAQIQSRRCLGTDSLPSSFDADRPKKAPENEKDRGGKEPTNGALVIMILMAKVIA